MRRRLSCSISIILACAMVFLLGGCSDGSPASDNSAGSRETRTSFLTPEASGTEVYSSDIVSIDASNSSEGYIMIKYSGSAARIKIQITGADGNTYTYTSHKGDYETFPLSVGSGNYRIDILENVQSNLYALILTQTISVSIGNDFDPFLYPNQYVWFTPDSEAVSLGEKLSEKSTSDIDYVTEVYDYVIGSISYDSEKASNVPVDYVPDIDETLKSGKGICFDYASLMAAVLRSQSIPTKLVVGYSGAAYHAWISVWLEETGWVDNVIEFDGNSWSLMDPTLGAGNSDIAVKEYIGDGTNYIAKYHY